MKSSFIANTLLILTLSIVLPFIGYAQNDILKTNITLRVKNVPVHEALSKVTEKTGYYFTYDGATLDANKIVNFIFKNESLENCLDQIFDNSNLRYKIIDNHIVIRELDVENKFTFILKDEEVKFIEIHGFITDSENAQPLSYAAVGIENQNIGTISNAQGAFVLKIPKDLIHENICVSFIGYSNTCIPVTQLYKEINTIGLKRNYISVQEVIIRSSDPRTIIREANKKIAENYSLSPNYMTTFYRESVKQKEKFMFFSEAILKIYKSSYLNDFDRDQLKVLKSRSFHDITNEDSVKLKLKSGLNDALFLDMVKHSSDFINEDNFKLYNYKMIDIIAYNDQPAYVIEFEQKESVKEALYVGRIYIDIDRLAFIGAEFSVNPEKVHQVHTRFIVKKERGLRVRIKRANYRVSYHEVNGKYYLRHVKGELKMRVKKKRKLFATNFETSLEMAICNIDSIDVQKFKRKETDKLNTIFVDEIREYDNSFWEEYNFIKPDDSWQEAVKKLQQKLQQKAETSLN